jgi:hypothetical protein
LESEQRACGGARNARLRELPLECLLALRMRQLQMLGGLGPLPRQRSRQSSSRPATKYPTHGALRARRRNSACSPRPRAGALDASVPAAQGGDELSPARLGGNAGQSQPPPLLRGHLLAPRMHCARACQQILLALACRLGGRLLVPRPKCLAQPLARKVSRAALCQPLHEAHTLRPKRAALALECSQPRRELLSPRSLVRRTQGRFASRAAPHVERRRARCVGATFETRSQEGSGRAPTQLKGRRRTHIALDSQRLQRVRELRELLGLCLLLCCPRSASRRRKRLSPL